MESITKIPRATNSCVILAVLEILAVLAVLTSCSTAPDIPAGAQAVVISVVDGDTLDAAFAVDGHRIEERIRLIGIDTPETKKPDSPVECFGVEAAQRLAQLVPPGTAIMVERDVESRDVYGRLLAHVSRHDDGSSVNLRMLAEGYAVTLVIAPNVAHSSAYASAERAARRARLGLWAACGGGHVPLSGSVTP